MTCLQTLIVSGKRQLWLVCAFIAHIQQRVALPLGILEMPGQDAGIGALKIVGGELALATEKYIAVGNAARPCNAVVIEVVDALDALHIHREALEPVGQPGRDGVAFDAADLLEIGELADLHAVEPDLPTEPPGAEGRALPIVLDKADVVL